MSDTDHMTERIDLLELRAAFSVDPVPPAPSLDGIRARGRARRRHRRYRVAIAPVVAVAAVGTGLLFGLTGAPDSAPASTLGTIRTAAYTLVSNANGTATLTINANELFDPTTLQDDLAHDGIPAKVTSGSFCESDPAPSGFAQVVSFDPGAGERPGEPARPTTLTIDPAAMPAGTELSIGELPLRENLRLSALALIDASSYTCTSTPPQNGPTDGMAFISVPGGSNGS